jgi:HSP20 family protein
MIKRRDDPFEEMRERMNELLRAFTDRETSLDQGAGRLPVDVQESDDQISVRADMPGVDKDSIQVRVKDGQLSLAAEGRREVTEEGKDYIRKERSRRQFSRTIPLPADVDSSTAEAEYSNGVLDVRIEKTDSGTGTEVDVQ